MYTGVPHQTIKEHAEKVELIREGISEQHPNKRVRGNMQIKHSQNEYYLETRLYVGGVLSNTVKTEFDPGDVVYD